MRTFDTGATRDSEDGKLDYEGFFSPLVLNRFAQYMHKHRVQADGNLRDSDNWQKGMPRNAYMKSMWRHFMDVWALHRGRADVAENCDIEEALCAVLFNVQGYLHEILARQEPDAIVTMHKIATPEELEGAKERFLAAYGRGKMA